MGNSCCSHDTSVGNLNVKPLKQWSADDVKATLKIFRDFDKDNSGAIDAAELKALCAALCIEANMSEADTLTKDGKIDPQEFFAWYVGCSPQEASAAFQQHGSIFAGLSGKVLKEWSGDEVKATLKVFRDFDKDKSGFIDAAELKELCAVLCIDAKVGEADTLQKDGKIDPKEFFAWYVGCNAEEAAVAFAQHGSLFADLRGKALKEWSEDEVKDTLKVFKQFDKDNSGAIDAAELKALCAVLCIEAKVGEADTLKKDGKIDPKEFFVWYVGCTAEEATATFKKHKNIFEARR